MNNAKYISRVDFLNLNNDNKISNFSIYFNTLILITILIFLIYFNN